MKYRIDTLVLLFLSARTAKALEMLVDETEANRQQCAGMYSKSAWGGPVDPFISLTFTDTGKDIGDDPVVSLLIFDWKDSGYIGILPPGASHKAGVCEPKYVDAGYCNSTELGHFMLAANASERSANPLMTLAVHLRQPQPVLYPITKTGYFCVLTDRYTATRYKAVAEFRNAYGELSGAQIPKLPFYGGLAIVYALLSVFWGLLYFQHRSDILAVQNYITAILVFLVVEMLMTWGFYDFLNRHGSTIGAKVLLILVATLNAARNSFSFFLLLIVCMGYGVVKATLGRTMIYVRWLAMAHFVFGLVYAVTSLLITPDTAGPFVLLIVFPLAGTLTAFYVWTLNSLNLTLKDLRERKQHAKESMYRRLWWGILGSILVIFIFFFFNSFTLASAADPDFAPDHWKSRWFVLDGWLNLVYLADVSLVAYVWRPTENNRRFAMSDEIAQDDDGTFEIANLDIGAPDEWEDDEGGRDRERGADVGLREYMTRPPPSSATPASQQAARRVPRESLDGETIFAVGEEGDNFSDESEEEGGRGTKK